MDSHDNGIVGIECWLDRGPRMDAFRMDKRAICSKDTLLAGQK